MASIINIYTDGITTGFSTITRPATTTVGEITTWQDSTATSLGGSGVSINGTQNISGVKSLNITPVAANPGNSSTLWVRSADNHLMVGSIDISAATMAGPISSGDNAIARFDSTSGRLLQDSAAILDDSGNISARSYTVESRPSNPGGTNTIWRSSMNGHLYHGNVDLHDAGSGDVIGPGASTQNAVVRWIGEDGSAASDSQVIIDDNGNISAVHSISLQSAAANPGGAATLWINSANGHLMVGSIDLSAEVVPGSGDVVGPASSGDGNLARFDGLTGKLLQDSGISLDDSANLTGIGSATFLAAGANPGGNRTLWVNSATGKLMRGSVEIEPTVGLATVDTLTNKTITSTTNNVAANSLKTATGLVSVAAATAPTSGQILTATSGTTATWQTPASSVGLATVDTFTNKTITSTTNNVAANSLKTASGLVSVAAATAPTSGQILTATSGTTATWQTPASGGGLRFARIFLSSAYSQAVSMNVNTKISASTTGNTNSPSLFTVGSDKITFIGANGTWVKILCRVNFGTDASGNQLWQIRLFKNGIVMSGDFGQSRAFFNSLSANLQSTAVITSFTQLNTNDYIEMFIINDSNSAPLYIYGFTLALEA